MDEVRQLKVEKVHAVGGGFKSAVTFLFAIRLI
jgi:hypothetical protein